MRIENEAIEAWENPANGFSMQNVYNQLLQSTKHRSLTKQKLMKLIKHAINNRESVQVFAPVKKSFFHMYIPKINFGRCQMDLMDMSNENVQANHGYKWIFVFIDAYTKYAFAIAMKTKSIQDILKAFKSIVNEIAALAKLPLVPPKGTKIYKINCDNESAFLSKQFQEFCKEKDISLDFIRPGDHKAACFVERLNLTLRQKIERLKITLKTPNWVDYLDTLISSYNNTIHSATKTTPKQALTDNSKFNEILDEQLDEMNQVTSSNAYMHSMIKVGDHVRVLLQKNTFTKGTKPRWSKSVHTVLVIDPGNRYFVTDRSSYYKDYELLPVNEVNEVTFKNDQTNESDNEKDHSSILNDEKSVRDRNITGESKTTQLHRIRRKQNQAGVAPIDVEDIKEIQGVYFTAPKVAPTVTAHMTRSKKDKTSHRNSPYIPFKIHDEVKLDNQPIFLVQFYNYPAKKQWGWEPLDQLKGYEKLITEYRQSQRSDGRSVK
jgi:hypothetical protein